MKNTQIWSEQSNDQDYQASKHKHIDINRKDSDKVQKQDKQKNTNSLIVSSSKKNG